MKQYTVLLGKSKKTIKFNAESLHEVAIVIASDLKDEYWGSTIYVEGQPEFMVLPSGEEYEKLDPMQNAFLGAAQSIKFKAGLTETRWDRDGEYRCSVSLSEALERGLLKYE